MSFQSTELWGPKQDSVITTFFVITYKMRRLELRWLILGNKRRHSAEKPRPCLQPRVESYDSNFCLEQKMWKLMYVALFCLHTSQLIFRTKPLLAQTKIAYLLAVKAVYVRQNEKNSDYLVNIYLRRTDALNITTFTPDLSSLIVPSRNTTFFYRKLITIDKRYK